MGMGDEHPNVLAYLRTVEAFRQGDLDTIASLVAEDVVWHVPGDHPLAGEYVGRERLLEFLARLGPLGFTIRERRERLPLPGGAADRALVLPGGHRHLEPDPRRLAEPVTPTG
jgi:hypothetical protein